MKALCKYLFLTVFSLSMAACGGNGQKEEIKPLEINYANLHGNWMLTAIGGKAPEAGTYCYISFDRSDKTYKMYQNMSSMYARLFTGKYELTKDDYEQTVISGTYDYTMGATWEHDYYISQMMPSGTMTWTAVDDKEDVCIYTRCDTIPSDIVTQAKE